MKESFPALSDDEGDESSSVTSPLLQGRKELARVPAHAISAPLLSSVRPKITRQRRYDRSLHAEDTRILNTAVGQDNSDWELHTNLKCSYKTLQLHIQFSDTGNFLVRLIVI